jgi:hypothetical protein
MSVHKWKKKELKEARVIASSIWYEFALKSVESRELIDSIKSWLTKNKKL